MVGVWLAMAVEGKSWRYGPTKELARVSASVAARDRLIGCEHPSTGPIETIQTIAMTGRCYDLNIMWIYL